MSSLRWNDSSHRLSDLPTRRFIRPTKRIFYQFLYQSLTWQPIYCVVVTQSFNGRRRWPVLCGNVEGADLKNNSQSTSHIDPQVGTGGMLRVLAFGKACVLWLAAVVCDTDDFGKAGKYRHLLAVCLAKDTSVRVAQVFPALIVKNFLSYLMWTGGRWRIQ